MFNRHAFRNPAPKGVDNSMTARVPMTDRTRRVARNTIFNYLSYGWRAILYLAATPYLVHRLSNDNYGIFAIALGTISYLEFLNVGLGDSITKYIAEDKDSHRRNQIITTNLVIYFVFGLLGAVLCAAFTQFFLLRLFIVPAGLHESFKLIFFVASISILFNLPLSVFPSVFRGLQRFDLVNTVTILVSTLNTAAMVGVVWLGGGVVSLMVVSTLVSTLGLSVNMFLLKRVMPEFRWGRAFFSRDQMRRLLTFGLMTSISAASGIVIYQCDITILGIFVPVGLVTYYVVANQLAFQVYQLAHLIKGVMFPAVSEMQGEGELESIRAVFQSSTILIIGITLPISIWMIHFSDAILQLWMGQSFSPAITPLRFLTVAWMINAVGCASTFTSQGIGKPRIEAVNAVLVAVVNVVLDFILIPSYGLLGAVIATTVAQVFGVARNVIVVGHAVNLPSLRHFLFRIGRAIAVGLLASAVLLPGKSGLAVALLKSALFFVCFSGLTWIVSFESVERDLIRSFLRKDPRHWFRAD